MKFDSDRKPVATFVRLAARDSESLQVGAGGVDTKKKTQQIQKALLLQCMGPREIHFIGKLECLPQLVTANKKHKFPIHFLAYLYKVILSHIK